MKKFVIFLCGIVLGIGGAYLIFGDLVRESYAPMFSQTGGVEVVETGVEQGLVTTGVDGVSTVQEADILLTGDALIEDTIQNYLVGLELAYPNRGHTLSGSKYFCQADIKWEYPFSETGKIVYAVNSCSWVVNMSGDLRGVGGGEGPGFFKLALQDGVWKVVDRDNRLLSPNETIKEEWLKKVDPLLPDEYRRACYGEKCFAPDGIIQQSAHYFGLQLPDYDLAYCSADEDCTQDEVCYQHGDRNPGPATCVKKCSGHAECGVGYSCRRQCVKGENGCPNTAVSVCVPDLLYVELDKDPHGVI